MIYTDATFVKDVTYPNKAQAQVVVLEVLPLGGIDVSADQSAPIPDALAGLNPDKVRFYVHDQRASDERCTALCTGCNQSYADDRLEFTNPSSHLYFTGTADNPDGRFIYVTTDANAREWAQDHAIACTAPPAA